MGPTFSSLNTSLPKINFNSGFDQPPPSDSLSSVDAFIRPIVLFLSLSFLLSGCGPLAQKPSIPALNAIKVLPIEAPYPIEPSGLALHNGRFYTIADKVDPIIFTLDFEEDVVRVSEAIVFYLPEKGPMDWEGLTIDPAGTFYLISETKGRVLRVTADGTASWATEDLRPSARALGLFAKENAGFEGITWLGPNHWLGAVEREPRGLVEWKGAGEGLDVTPYLQSNSPFLHALSLLRLADFSGLDWDGSACYGLFRNAHLVVSLQKSAGKWTETAAWDYRAIETDPQFAYRNQTFGQAEGLVVRDKDVYLIFDNNRGPRQSDPNDRRPLFVHAQMP